MSPRICSPHFALTLPQKPSCSIFGYHVVENLFTSLALQKGVNSEFKRSGNHRRSWRSCSVEKV
ncbi:hypothetical protein LINPERPRIM_LOCUS1025, partial [Linum perenne]